MKRRISWKTFWSIFVLTVVFLIFAAKMLLGGVSYHSSIDLAWAGVVITSWLISFLYLQVTTVVLMVQKAQPARLRIYLFLLVTLPIWGIIVASLIFGIMLKIVRWQMET